MRGSERAAPKESTMIVRTNKAADFRTSTLAGIVAHQDTLQASMIDVQIGRYEVSLSDLAWTYSVTVADVADVILADPMIEMALEDLRDEARAAGGTEQARLCARALAGDIAALKSCIAVLDDAAAQG